jgi:hypothetical protein
MDCQECAAALDVSATKDNYLRCRPCRLLFVVKKDGELMPMAVEPPDGFDEGEFFASFTRNLGFEDDEEIASSPSVAPAARGRGWLWLVLGLLVLGAAAILASTQGVFR